MSGHQSRRMITLNSEDNGKLLDNLSSKSCANKEKKMNLEKDKIAYVLKGR